MRLVLLVLTPFLLIGLAGEIRQPSGMDLGLLMFGLLVIGGATMAGNHIKRWGDQQGAVGQVLAIVALVALAVVIVAAGGLALQGVNAGR